MLPDDDMRCAIETCRSSDKCFNVNNFRLIYDIQDAEAPGGEKWELLKRGGKQWQATPKNLPRMQRTRAIPVA